MRADPAILRGIPLILGTSSPWRRKVLASTELPFSVLSADIDEKAIRYPDPRAMTLNIALAKAAALLERISTPSILVTCDQVAVFRGEVREKPESGDQARRWLHQYGEGDQVDCVTSVVVVDTAKRRSIHAIDVASAWFDPIPVRAVEEAIAAGGILRSCGAYAIDDPALAPFVVRVAGDGDEAEVRTSIDGLPRAKTLRLIEETALRAF